MARHLVIWLGGPFEAEWMVLEGSDQPLQGPLRGSLESAASAARGSRVTVLVPGVEVLLARAAVPALSRQRLLKAVPYALEDQLAADVETLHFAVGGPDDAGQPAVAVVARERMDAWLEALRAAGINPNALTPDTLAVPWRENTWSVLVLGERALVRSGLQDGFAAEAESLNALLRLQLDGAGEAPPESIELYGDFGEGSGLSQELAGLGIALSEHPGGEGGLPWLVEGIADRPQINLRQGSYAPEERLVQVLRPWRAAAALLGIWLAVSMVGSFLETWRLERESQALAEQIRSVVSEAFPEIRRVVRPRVQMERELDALRKERGGDGGGFLSLLAAAAKGLQGVDGVELQGLQYRQGRLELDVTLTSMSGLDPLRQSLEQAGNLDAQVSARSREGVVEGKVRITGKQG
jgi:general secretion pathway protein L